MGKTSTGEYLAVGILSFAAAVLAVVINETTGEWPTDFGLWGVALFVLIGIALVAVYLRERTG